MTFSRFERVLTRVFGSGLFVGVFLELFGMVVLNSQTVGYIGV